MPAIRSDLVVLVVVLQATVGVPASKAAAASPVSRFTGHAGPVQALTFSADATRVVSASARDVRTWESATGKELAAVEVAGGTIAAVAPDGKTVAFTSNERVGLPVMLRAAADGKELLTIRPHADVTERTAFGSLVGKVAFSPDGSFLATAGRSGLVGGPHGLPGGVVKVWEARTGKQLLHVPGPRPGVSTSAFAGAVAFSRDGKYIAAGTDGAGGELPESGEVIVWDTTEGKRVRAIQVRETVSPGDFRSAVTAVALSPEGKQVAASYGNRPARADGLLLSDPPTAALQLWEVASGRIVHILRGHKSAVAQLAFSPDGKQLASAGSDQVVRIWDTSTGQELNANESDLQEINALAFSLDGKRLAAGGNDGNQRGLVLVWSNER
jgi:WD40 repeat protein